MLSSNDMGISQFLGLLILLRLYYTVACDYNCPVFPDYFEMGLPEESATLVKKSKANITNPLNEKQKVPRYMWISAVNITWVYWEFEHVEMALDNNPGWTLFLADDKTIDDFMMRYFKGTSLLWAFQNIDRKFGGAARVDIWRYSILYVFGGLYIDSDSCIWSHLDSKLLKEQDELLVSYERHHYSTEECYLYNSKFSSSSKTAKYSLAENSHLVSDQFHMSSNVILNWLIVSTPRHATLRTVLENFVYAMKMDYLGFPVIKFTSYRDKVLCLTGPQMFTASCQEAAIRIKLGHFNNSENSSSSETNDIHNNLFVNNSGDSRKRISAAVSSTNYRIGSRDFIHEDAHFKFIDPKHPFGYRAAPIAHSLLMKHASENESIVEMWKILNQTEYKSTVLIRGHHQHNQIGHSPIFLVKNGHKLDLALNTSSEEVLMSQLQRLNYTVHQVWTLPAAIVDRIPFA